jgi:N-acetyl-anhydromuramyl-L-alanine amidase AmpD
VVDTDGTIIRLFDEKYWSYHLGIRGADSENWRHDKRSIGIEIVNIGPVWKHPDGMLYEDYTHRRTYGEDDIVLGKNRDADGGVKFPDIQMDSVIQLVNWLMIQYDIPRKMIRNPMECNIPQARELKGVCYHQTFRIDKYDMGVAFAETRFRNECRLETV